MEIAFSSKLISITSPMTSSKGNARTSSVNFFSATFLIRSRNSGIDNSRRSSRIVWTLTENFSASSSSVTKGFSFIVSD